MMTERRRCPPAPPADFSADLPTIQLRANPHAWVRVFWKSRRPLTFAKSRHGNRFDPLAAPWDKTRVLYAGTTLEVAIAEALLRWHGEILPGESVLLSKSGDLQHRGVARFVPTRELTLIDASGLRLAAFEEIVTAVLERSENREWKDRPKPIADDIFQCGAEEYPETQRWASWFRSQAPSADGIVWVSRQYNLGQCLVLFADRCGRRLKLDGKVVPLYGRPSSAERQVVDRMLGELGWGLEP